MKHLKRPSWRRRASALLGVVLLLANWSIPAAAQNRAATDILTAAVSQTPFVPGIVVARRKATTSRDSLQRAVAGVTSLTELPLTRVEQLQVPVGQELATSASLIGSGLVEYAEPDYLMHTTDYPNDPDYPQQWSLPLIDAPAAWGITTGSNRVIVAVIDTGFDLGHPDQPVNLIAGPTYTSGSAPLESPPCPPEGTNGPQDDYGHGTHVGGIIAAATNNGQGVAGLAPAVSELVIKAGDCDGNLSDTDVALAIEYALANGARVINMSFGGPPDSQVIDQAVQDAWNGGLILVAAAGNSHSSAPFYPAATPNVVGVSATDQYDNIAYFSNYGTYVALAAPGVSILSTVPPGAPVDGYAQVDYADLSGTSMASPHVAAVAALVLSVTCGLSNTQVIAALEKGAKALGSPVPNPIFGYGRVDALGALLAAGLTAPPPPGPTPIGLTPRAVLPSVLRPAC